jgi:hypothetical protein
MQVKPSETESLPRQGTQSKASDVSQTRPHCAICGTISWIPKEHTTLQGFTHECGFCKLREMLRNSMVTPFTYLQISRLLAKVGGTHPQSSIRANSNDSAEGSQGKQDGTDFAI